MNIDTQHLDKILKPFSTIEKFFDCDISKLSTMRLKSQGHYLLIDLENEEIGEIIQALSGEKIPYKMIGWGANQILPEDARDRVFIKIKSPADPSLYISEIADSYLLPAGFPLHILVSRALNWGFMGWEVLTGIPASLGGATYMNAGTKFGDISNIIESVLITRSDGYKKRVSIAKQSYSYRKNHFVQAGDVITHIEIKNLGINLKDVAQKITDYMDYRKKTQPLQSSNCGCIFKNMDGVSAGKIIDDLGLKGTRVGGMKVSTLHGNFLENHNNATATDFWELVTLIQTKVKDNFGKEFELEITS